MSVSEQIATGLVCELAGADEVLLTRQEASDYLLTLGIRMKPKTLARAWSTGGNGPPCMHIRRKPYYPREVLRAWAAEQVTGLRSSSGTSASIAAQEASG